MIVFFFFNIFLKKILLLLFLPCSFFINGTFNIQNYTFLFCMFNFKIHSIFFTKNFRFSVKDFGQSAILHFWKLQDCMSSLAKRQPSSPKCSRSCGLNCIRKAWINQFNCASTQTCISSYFKCLNDMG